MALAIVACSSGADKSQPARQLAQDLRPGMALSEVMSHAEALVSGGASPVLRLEKCREVASWVLDREGSTYELLEIRRPHYAEKTESLPSRSDALDRVDGLASKCDEGRIVVWTWGVQLYLTEGRLRAVGQALPLD